MRSDHRARRGGAGPLCAVGIALRVVGIARSTALAAVLLVAGPFAAGLRAQSDPQPFASPSPAPVQGEDLSPTPIAPPVATPPPAAGPTLEQQAEEKYAAGDLEGAAAIYRQLAVATSAPQERLRLLVAAAWLEHQLGQADVAYDLLRQGLVDLPDYPFQPQNYSQEFVDIFVKARDRALAERHQRANELVQRSLREIAAEDMTRARATLVQALALQPDDPFGLFNLGLVEMKTAHRDQAITNFERLLAVEAGKPGTVPVEVRSPALATLGLLYYEKDFLEDAKRYLEQAAALDPASSRTWNNLGLTLGKAGDAAGAERAFRKGLEIAPDNAQLANNLAQLLMNAQRWNDAVTLLTPVTAGANADALAWLNYGLAQRGAGDRAGAGTSLQRVLALDADNKQGLAARAAVYLALVRFDQGDGAGAIAAARQAIGWRPDDVDAWTYLGLAQKLQKDLAGARDSLQRAATLDAARPEIHNNLGTVLFALNDLAGAEAEFRQALTLRPGFAQAQSNLDQVLVAQLAGKVGTSSATSSKPDSGRPRRQPKYVGVHFSDADFTYLGIKGAMVESVMSDSPAAKAGLRKGDVVLGIDGNPVEGPQQLLRYLRNLTGERDYVEMDVLRDGSPRRLRVDMF
ncbi:MAG TPA: tetratricopeptide repeat protein [Thermoanaerobaculia bacterium]|jgi:Tfp pilus assembly protein PilF|nr:tetratricopeptide repeat protein [Thermoanaerobaculia bacterium]